MGYTVGIDIGSTTVKVVVMEGEQLLFQRYERHFSQVRQKTAQMLEAAAPVLDGHTFTVALSGSAGFGLSKAADIPFEVLQKVMNRIVNEVKGVNRVMYDLTSKPPGTIEFE